MTGYCGYLPTSEGRDFDVGEKPISVFKKMARELNKEWALKAAKEEN